MRTPRLLLAALAALVLLQPPDRAAAGSDRSELQDTWLMSVGHDGRPANGDSRNPVISQDRRYATVIAFESDATNLTPGDGNGLTDVFFIQREGPNRLIDNEGSRWTLTPPQLASRGRGGQPANGRSWGAAVDGGFAAPSKYGPTYARCVAFLSDASNLVRSDTNGVTDAFVVRGSKVRGPRGNPRRISLLPKSVFRRGSRQIKQVRDPVTEVAVSTDCSHIAFVSGGKLYVRTTVGKGKRRRTLTRRVTHSGVASNPSFASGQSDDLVFDTPAGVHFQKEARGRPQSLVPGARNPAYNDVKCRVVAYEKRVDGVWQVAYRYLGISAESPGNNPNCHLLPVDAGEERIASSRGGRPGDGDSRDPYVVNSGFYIGFESDAGNLGTASDQMLGDRNGVTDSYVYTGVRDLTLVMSQDPGLGTGTPFATGGRGTHPAWYLNYVLFSSRGSQAGPEQIWMRYLGPA